MPLTVITLKNSPASLRGDLTKWMQEISTGVYVGNFNIKIREEIWKRVIESVGVGEATMTFAYRNEIGYNFETHNSTKIPIDFDGIPLVLTPLKQKEKENVEEKHGFSNAAKIRKAKKFAQESFASGTVKYTVLDLETTGIDYKKDRIIEIGAIKVTCERKEYQTLIKIDKPLSENIKKLTGITDEDLIDGMDEAKAINELLEFIGDDKIVGYNINFDIKFINEALKRQGLPPIKNKIFDIMKYAKKEKMFLKNYKLETVIREYGIKSEIPHRALEDVKIILELTTKVNGFSEIIK